MVYGSLSYWSLVDTSFFVFFLGCLNLGLGLVFFELLRLFQRASSVFTWGCIGRDICPLLISYA